MDVSRETSVGAAVVLYRAVLFRTAAAAQHDADALFHVKHLEKGRAPRPQGERVAYLLRRRADRLARLGSLVAR